MHPLIEKFEKVIMGSLVVLMIVVVAVATIELAWLIIKDLWTPPIFFLEIDELLDIFGLFLLVLIGLELLETIHTYHKERLVRVEVVVLVAIIAIARKIIVTDYKNLTSFSLLDAGALVLALAVAYYLLQGIKRRGAPPSPRGPDAGNET